MLGGALALNTVIDEERRLSFVSFGEIVASHLDAVRFMSEYAEVPVAERFRTVVTSAAGYPLDKTYYQTVKGMVTPMAIMAPGADLIIASACSEGMGSREFVEAQRRLVERGPERFLEEIGAKRFADIDEWQTEMQLKPMRIGSIQLYSDGLRRDGARADRRRDDRLGRGGGRGEHRALGRPAGRGDPRGALRRSGVPAGRLSMGRPVHLHLDPLGGLAGDMFLAALLDAHPEHAEGAFAAMRAAGLPEGWQTRLVRHDDGALSGPSGGDRGTRGRSGRAAPALRRPPRGPAGGAARCRPVRERAIAIFTGLAEAEAAVHGVALDEVHFHELADWDSVADIVGAAWLIEALAPSSWSVAPLPSGGGRIDEPPRRSAGAGAGGGQAAPRASPCTTTASPASG